MQDLHARQTDHDLSTVDHLYPNLPLRYFVQDLYARRTNHDLQIDHLGPILPLRYVVRDLYSTDPTQKKYCPCRRSWKISPLPPCNMRATRRYYRPGIYVPRNIHQVDHKNRNQFFRPEREKYIDLRGPIVNRTYGTHKNLPIYISLFLPTVFGPIYYGPT